MESSNVSDINAAKTGNATNGHERKLRGASYNIYNFIFRSLMEHECRARRIVDRHKRIMRSIGQDILRQTGGVAAFCFSLEKAQRAEGNHVLFPDAGLLDFISRSTFAISPEGLSLPFKRFAICFPKEYLINGESLPGLLVGQSTYEAEQMRFKRFCKSYDYPSPGLPLNDHADGLFLQYNAHDFPLPFSIFRTVHFPTHEVSAALSTGKVNYAATNQAALADTKIALPIVPDDDLHKRICIREHNLLRMVAGLGVFCAAFPDALEAGFPTVSPSEYSLDEHIVPHRLNVPPRFLEKQGTPKDMHWRSAHFRELRSERFKRDHRGNIRVVAVRSSVVHGRPISPYVLQFLPDKVSKESATAGPTAVGITHEPAEAKAS